MRVTGAVLIVLGLLISLTIVGAIIGIPMMLIGLALVIAGRSDRPVIVHMTQNAAQYHPEHRPPSPPPPPYPAAQGLPGYASDAEALRLASAPHSPPPEAVEFSRTCPQCGRRYGGDAQFCVAEGAALV